MGRREIVLNNGRSSRLHCQPVSAKLSSVDAGAALVVIGGGDVDVVT